PEVSMGRIINVPSGLRMLNYAENEQWHFGLTRQQDKRQLVKYHQQSAKKEVLLHTDHPIEILEHHPQQNALLLQVGQQLMVLSIDNNSVELVSSSQSYLDSHAAFSLDGNYVYFGQLIAGEWELHQFERANQRSRQLIKGYRAARQTPQGYIAASG